MQIDKNLIQGKIDIIEKDLNFLGEYRDISNENFLNSYKDIQAVKYSLFETIEACIDIASHIIAIKGLERAETYSEMFQILEKNDFLDSNLSKKLSNMAKFRNILVHGYAKIDNSRVLEFVKNELIDIKNFVKNVLELIKNQV